MLPPSFVFLCFSCLICSLFAQPYLSLFIYLICQTKITHSNKENKKTIFLYQFYFVLPCSHAALELVSLPSHLSFFLLLGMFVLIRHLLSPGQMRSILPSMTAPGTLRCCEAMSICHIPLLSPCMVARCTGLTGAQIPWPRLTSGQAITSRSCSEPTHSPLICRSITPLASLKVSHDKGKGAVGE